jgi:UDP-N-acetylglucosamine 1-carboxyvinyltransferase
MAGSLSPGLGLPESYPKRSRSHPRRRDHVLLAAGGRPLFGRISISGSKNASLPIMAASLLTPERVTLRNVPAVADTDLMRQILVHLGVSCRTPRKGSLTLVGSGTGEWQVPDELGRKMRASIVLLGALLARSGHVRLPRPGGDDIGARRVEQHIRGLRQMGAEIVETERDIVARAERLRGTRIILDIATVSGTENVMMAAVQAEGRTEIFNAAREPHVQDLARFLNAMGAQIRGAGTDEIVIEGVERLHGVEHTVIPDYLEAGTYAIAVAATGGEVLLDCSPPRDLTTVLFKLEQTGAEIETGPDTIRVRRQPRRRLQAVDMGTWVHPGFPTDLQAQYLALMTRAHGTAVISEYLFENRFQHVPELLRMGARISVDGRSATVHGPAELHGTDVLVSDIRSGAALIIAALCAKGTTELRGARHVDRGYEDLVGKLSQLGARIERASAGRHGALPSTNSSFE